MSKQTETTSFASVALPQMLSSYFDGSSWSEIVVEPFRDLAMSPFARVLHYGQSVFEGMKAVRGIDGVSVFRAREHLERLNRSADRLCMPSLDVEAVSRAIDELVGRFADAVPEYPGSLYVRPVVHCADEGLAPDPGERYRFLVLLAPIQPLFDSGRLVRLTTCPGRIRSAPGGTGAAKCAGNYAGAMLAKREARSAGFDEVLWLDAVERRFVEETGSMNVMLVKDGCLVTPPAGDTVLPGMTRATLLWLAAQLGIEARVEPVPIDADAWSGVTEVFSSGTAAGTAPIGHVEHEGRVLFESDAQGPICSLLSEAYAATVTGRRPAPSGWRRLVASSRARLIRA